ncbi:hypothetical protein [Aquimarina rhabdastrellae]
MEILNKVLPKKKEEIAAPQNTIAIQKKDYLNEGYDTSKACRGRASNLKTGLEMVYEKYFNQCKLDEHKQKQLKQPYLTELNEVTTDIKNKENEVQELTQQITTHREDIQQIKQDIILVKKQPENFGIDIEHKSNIKLWIGLVFLIPLSFYIFIFYISTAYSAFFKKFDSKNALFETVFEADALTRALEDGPLELGFVLFIPFVFFSLGYLIHMFWERKTNANYIKVVGLLLITFLFDAILAYLIDEKVHELNRRRGELHFSISMAIQNANFWLIIFAGFVSYIVWGLVFDMVMNENAKRFKIQVFKRSKNEAIQDKTKLIDRTIKKRTRLKEKLDELSIKSIRLESIVAGFILPIQNYKTFAVEYLKGWQKFIAAELTLGKNEQEQLISDCRAVYNDHMTALDLETDDYQNKVYTPKL